jgi:cyclopropane fatty-acyl-phospholipid synthase-like methyltransferase
MKELILKFLNPIVWLRAKQYQESQAKYNKSNYDLELYLYSKILKNDMLHYGYFENSDVEPDTISIKQFEDAQIQYAQNIINLIRNQEGAILDVGCGMGGLSKMMLAKNMKVEALTPNANQVEYIAKQHPSLKVHHMIFEAYDATQKKFKTIINSESLQYIRLDDAFAKVNSALEQDGRWIICDYFRREEAAANRSGHVYDVFLQKVTENGWKVVYEQDISLNILPTIKFVNLYAQRFLLPVKHFALEKLRFKKPWLYFMVSDLRVTIDQKIEKELKTINPEIFLNDKKYVLLVLERQN